MALNSREKTLVGVMIGAVGLAAVFYFGLPLFTATQDNLTTINDGKVKTENNTLQIQTLEAQIAKLEQAKILPKDIVIRTFTPDTKEREIKVMIDQIVNQATLAGNQFVSLKPYEVTPIVPDTVAAPSTAPPTATGGAAPAAASTTVTPPAVVDPANPQAAATAPPPAPQVQVDTYGYETEFRGTYETVQNFLKKLDLRQELIEVMSIQVRNEGGAQRSSTTASGTTGIPLDPSKPIRLLLKIRLVLQPAT